MARFGCGGVRPVTLPRPLKSYQAGTALAFHPHLGSIAASAGSEIKKIWEVEFDEITLPTSYGNCSLHDGQDRTCGRQSGVGKTGMGWRLAHGSFREITLPATDNSSG